MVSELVMSAEIKKFALAKDDLSKRFVWDEMKRILVLFWNRILEYYRALNKIPIPFGFGMGICISMDSNQL
jgi:hypothetical protein